MAGMPHPLPRLLVIVVLVLVPVLGRSHSVTEAGREMAAAANAWVNSLSAEQRPAALFKVADAERENWHYIPKAREGLTLAKMTEVQRKLARALLASGLSQQGLLQADAVIALERVLRAVEGAAHRDDSL